MATKERLIIEGMLGYLAGYFDGEGAILARRQERKTATQSTFYGIGIQVAGCEREPLDRFCSAFGGAVYLRNYRPQHRPLFVWRLSTIKGVIRFLEAIRPFLLVKATRADLALEFLHNYRGMSEERKQTYYVALRALNDRGSAGDTTRTAVLRALHGN